MKTANVKNALRKIIFIVLFLSLFLAVFDLSAVAVSYAADSVTAFEKTNVLDDLRSSSVNGKPFELSDYPYDESGSVQIISFVEYCYAARKADMDNYGMYLYVYNPQSLTLVTDYHNKAQLAVAYDGNGAPSDYEKFDLKFCSMSSGNYDKLFYKFKIKDHKSADGKTIAQRVNPAERRYDLSGVELLTYGEVNATEYTVGGTFNFSGYAAGYGLDAQAGNTLRCDVKELETIRLDVRSTNFRPEVVSSAGKGHQNEITSVFFAVPDEVLNKYGSLQKIKCEWFETKTSPICVVNDKTAYNRYLPALGKTAEEYPSDYVLAANYEYHPLGIISSAFYESCDWWAYNPHRNIGNDDLYSKLDRFAYMFYAPKSQKSNSKSKINEWIKKYTASYAGGKLLDKYSADLFSGTVDAGRTYGWNRNVEIDADGAGYDLWSYDSNNTGFQGWWQKFKDYGFWAPEIPTSGDYTNIRPIYLVSDSDIKGDDAIIAENLYINESDVAGATGFKEYFNAAKKEKKSTFLFRFAQRDYYSTNLCGDIYYTAPKTEIGFAAQETVFLDFDIITLTFARNGNYRVIPVVSSPIDIISGVTAPIDNPDGLPDLLKKILKIIGMILGAIAVVLLIILLAPLLPYLLSAVLWVITAPFKAIKKSVDNYKQKHPKKPKKTAKKKPKPKTKKNKTKLPGGKRKNVRR